MKNQTMIQYFEWYYPDDGTYYDDVCEHAAFLKHLGFSMIWMPPAYKGSAGIHDVGYGVYDMYDLGEFDQKGTIRTKYGTKEQYLEAIRLCRKNGLAVLADIVFNHRMGADAKERIKGKQMNWNNREQAISDEEDVEVWTKYTFPGRAGKYSDFVWDWTCFDGTDYDDLMKRNELIQFSGKTWDPNVSSEQGNFDFIMGDDLDFSEPKVVQELYNWGRWYYETTHVDGYRLDAVKSIDANFFPGWLKQQRTISDEDDFAVGEYWSGNLDELLGYLNKTSYTMTLFDVPLHFHFFDASHDYDRYDMSKILDGTLTQAAPQSAVAFVDNHDTQPGQALESWVESWFKPHAYAILLLRNCLFPCVFYGDIYGIEHDAIEPVPHIREMVWLRRYVMPDEIDLYLEDRFDDPHCIGWAVCQAHPVVVVMTNGVASSKEFDLKNAAGKEFYDITSSKIVHLDENMHGVFPCDAGSCNIYVDKETIYRLWKEV
ncbi:alpha-amylase [Catenisphaera adipataccumulans]|jgi:alpha-amylase|uniref:Alpha-amylase n=1 Tax=Catenisphaera adipataccumulans TaxID=700500 RepID=A0A7W8CYH1_9FIRM|nr:alpha-amylase [Catenisphaera adipataccumulans]MBB5183960.1 alpha-amylase [Catenisphaera adipataccumulans]